MNFDTGDTSDAPGAEKRGWEQQKPQLALKIIEKSVRISGSGRAKLPAMGSTTRVDPGLRRPTSRKTKSRDEVQY